jgi:hypothetical protein
MQPAAVPYLHNLQCNSKRPQILSQSALMKTRARVGLVFSTAQAKIYGPGRKNGAQGRKALSARRSRSERQKIRTNVNQSGR